MVTKEEAGEVGAGRAEERGRSFVAHGPLDWGIANWPLAPPAECQLFAVSFLGFWGPLLK